MIEVNHIRKQFGEVEALRDVSFVANAGEVTALLGPNGAGKTTLLRLMAGLYKPDSGVVRFNGVDVQTHRKQVQQMVGILPDARGLYEHLTGRENIVYYGRLYGLSKTEITLACDGWIEQMDMHSFIDRKTKGYSQGQRVKTALARALIHDPDVVILDEPTNGLDIKAVRQLRTIIRNLKAQGKCVLFSTHIMQEVSALCDRIVMINEGVVIANGDEQQIVAACGGQNLEDAFVSLVYGEHTNTVETTK